MQRTKGATGEREVSALIRDLTGWQVTRRVRQHDGDSDLVGIPGWSAEVKRHKGATRAVIAAWWRQTVAQATQVAKTGENAVPVLFYRLDRNEWRAVWPVAVMLTEQRAHMWEAYAWTAETTVEAWAAVAREVAPNPKLTGACVRSSDG